jgi:hypothetical protein
LFDFISQLFDFSVLYMLIVYYCQNLVTSGVCCVTGSNGKYWCVDKDGFISAESASAQPFYMELCGQSKCVLRASNGCYLKGEQNGIITAKSADRAVATAWEY